MIAWNQQGLAWTGQVALTDGRRGTVVVVDGVSNPNGAALVLPSEGEAGPQHMPIQDAAAYIPPWIRLEVTCMQERAFGNHGLPGPDSGGA